jgi:hypothetical protein
MMLTTAWLWQHVGSLRVLNRNPSIRDMGGLTLICRPSHAHAPSALTVFANHSHGTPALFNKGLASTLESERACIAL